MIVAWAGAAQAHHILGIPHYKYGEEYPQIPYVEILAQTGSMNLHFTYFPGTPNPGERIRFKLYAYDRESKQPFREPLRVDVVRERWLLSDPVVAGPTEITTGMGPEANDYKFFFTFDDATSYKVRVYFPTADGVETISFPVQIGETDTRPLFGGALMVLFLSVGTVAFIKRRRKRAA